MSAKITLFIKYAIYVVCLAIYFWKATIRELICQINIFFIVYQVLN